MIEFLISMVVILEVHRMLKSLISLSKVKTTTKINPKINPPLFHSSQIGGGILDLVILRVTPEEAERLERVEASASADRQKVVPIWH